MAVCLHSPDFLRSNAVTYRGAASQLLRIKTYSRAREDEQSQFKDTPPPPSLCVCVFEFVGGYQRV